MSNLCPRHRLSTREKPQNYAWEAVFCSAYGENLHYSFFKKLAFDLSYRRLWFWNIFDFICKSLFLDGISASKSAMWILDPRTAQIQNKNPRETGLCIFICKIHFYKVSLAFLYLGSSHFEDFSFQIFLKIDLSLRVFLIWIFPREGLWFILL